MRKQILYYALIYKGEYQQMKKAIEKNENWEEIDYSGNYITILDELYPKILFELEYPPLILFYEGNLSLLEKNIICIIGSRKCSAYASQSCFDLISNLPKEDVIVSGLALGIDALAHQRAIQLGHKCIGVIGCGCNVVYPKHNKALYEEIKKNHLLISEYPNDVMPLAHHFPWRNRILACLGKKCYVVEAKSKSGTMVTANYALTLNREIIAFPYRYNDDFGRGCNELIEQGASIYME
ncbi:MAG: DNA-processing protein DprA [Traorella sp.]